MEEKNPLQEIQLLEQSLQNLLFQKQAFQMEISETESALKEIEDAGDEVFKIIGGLMIKSEKSKILEDLNKKKKILDLRMKTLDNQESIISEKIEKVREPIESSNKER